MPGLPTGQRLLRVLLVTRKAALVKNFCIHTAQSGKQASVKWTPGQQLCAFWNSECQSEIFIERRTSVVWWKGSLIGLSMTQQLWPNWQSNQTHSFGLLKIRETNFSISFCFSAINSGRNDKPEEHEKDWTDQLSWFFWGGYFFFLYVASDEKLNKD